MGGARCHDHKYDPVKQRDFYSMFAFFNNVREGGLVYNFGNDEPMLKAPTPEMSSRLAVLDAAATDAERRWASMGPALEKEQRKWEKTVRGDWAVSAGLVYRNALDACSDPCSLVDGKRGRAMHFDGKFSVNAGDK